jgi:hypothetical protein
MKREHQSGFVRFLIDGQAIGGILSTGACTPSRNLADCLLAGDRGPTNCTVA